jgi:hypothetical protein
MPGHILRELFDLWNERERSDEFMGTLVNAWIGRGGEARGIRAGESYVDIGTLHGYRAAITLLSSIDTDGTEHFTAPPQPTPKRSEPILAVSNR